MKRPAPDNAAGQSHPSRSPVRRARVRIRIGLQILWNLGECAKLAIELLDHSLQFRNLLLPFNTHLGPQVKFQTLKPHPVNITKVHMDRARSNVNCPFNLLSPRWGPFSTELFTNPTFEQCKPSPPSIEGCPKSWSRVPEGPQPHGRVSG